MLTGDISHAACLCEWSHHSWVRCYFQGPLWDHAICLYNLKPSKGRRGYTKSNGVMALPSTTAYRAEPPLSPAAGPSAGPPAPAPAPAPASAPAPAPVDDTLELAAEGERTGWEGLQGEVDDAEQVRAPCEGELARARETMIRAFFVTHYERQRTSKK